MKYTCSQQLRNDAQIKGTQRLKEVNDAIKFINEKFEEFEADRREKERDQQN